MEDFSIREATASDKEGVLGIDDNVYEGSDYLPVYYGHFISSPDITPFVLLHKDKIIGFSAAHIVDGGETFVSRAVRLNPEYQGRGLYGYLDKHILEWAKEKGISTKAFTSSDRNTNTGKRSFQAVNTLLHSKIRCDPTLEPSRQDSSNDGSQDIFGGEIWLIILKLSLLPSTGTHVSTLTLSEEYEAIQCSPVLCKVSRGCNIIRAQGRSIKLTFSESVSLSLNTWLVTLLNMPQDTKYYRVIRFENGISSEEKNICIYGGDTTKLNLKSTVESITDGLTNVPDCLLNTYISEKAFKQYLFPTNRIVVDYVPLQLLESNIPLMRGPYDVTTVFSDVRCINDQCTGLLSFNTIYPIIRPSFHCSIEMFGTDEASLKKHMEQHLKLIKHKTEGSFSIQAFIEKQISTELLDKIFLEYGVKRVNWRHPITNDIICKDSLLFEKPLFSNNELK